MIKKLICLLLLVSVVFTAIDPIDAWNNAGIYVKTTSGETQNSDPYIAFSYSGQEYYVYDVSNYGNVQFMIPINSETGSVEYSSSAKEIMKVYYLANFFHDDVGFDSFLGDLSSFGGIQQANLKRIKNTLIVDVDTRNISIDSEEEYKRALEIAITDTGELIAASKLKDKLELINSYDDVSSIELGFNNVFTKEQELLDSLEEVINKSKNFEIEVKTKYNSGEIDQSDYIVLMSAFVSIDLETIIDNKKDQLSSNKVVINEFFNGMNPKIDQFYVTLTKRIDSTSDDNVIKEIVDTLTDYSTTYSVFVVELDNKGIPSSYNDVKDEMDDLSELIEDSKKFCEDDDLEECKKAMSNYKDIDSFILSINSSINSYSGGCSSGQRRACTDGGESGIETCSNGVWGSCVVSASDGYNLILIAGLVIVVLALIAFKFKDKIMESISGGSEPEEEDTGGWQSQWNQ